MYLKVVVTATVLKMLCRVNGLLFSVAMFIIKHVQIKAVLNQANNCGNYLLKIDMESMQACLCKDACEIKLAILQKPN